MLTIGVCYREKSQQRNWLEMRVRSDADAGLVMLQHRSSTTDDDFLAIALDAGHVEVALNLGKDRPRDPLVIRSSVIVADRQWHTITFSRYQRISAELQRYLLPGSALARYFAMAMWLSVCHVDVLCPNN